MAADTQINKKTREASCVMQRDIVVLIQWALLCNARVGFTGIERAELRNLAPLRFLNAWHGRRQDLKGYSFKPKRRNQGISDFRSKISPSRSV